MTKVTRRSFVQVLLAIPLLAPFAKAAEGVKGVFGRPTWERRMLAVRVLRLFNTAQLWFKGAQHRYGTFKELLDSEAINRLRALEDDVEYGIGSPCSKR